MNDFWPLLLALCMCIPLPVHAQESSENCQVGSLSLSASADSGNAGAPLAKRAPVTNPRPAAAVSPATEAEAYVQEVIKKKGVHVVHFWAPWCNNSTRELANGWDELVTHNTDVTFTFVTVWNSGKDGATVLEKHDLPDRVTEVTQPDLGPSDQESNRRQSFLSHPVTWIPSTWIFHNKGELAFALNYGEMKMSTIQSLLDATKKDW